MPGTVSTVPIFVYIQSVEVFQWNVQFHCTYHIRVSGYNFQKNCILLSENPFYLYKQSIPCLYSLYILLHFIWVFTVCQSRRLGVSRMQRVMVPNYLEIFLMLRRKDILKTHIWFCKRNVIFVRKYEYISLLVEVFFI